MPDSKTLAANHADIAKTLDVSPSTLGRWVFAAPMLLLVPAAQLRKRLDVLSTEMASIGQQLGDMLAAEDAAAAAAAAAGTSAAAAGAAAAAAAAAGTVSAGESGAGGINMLAAEQAAALAAAATATAADAASTGNGNGSSSSSSGSLSENSSSVGALGPWLPVAHEPLQVLAYVSKDPRVLLLNPEEIRKKRSQLSNELGLGLWLASWLVVSHPSYMAMEPGLATQWMDDVRHLTGMMLLQAKRLAACPQVCGHKGLWGLWGGRGG
jgi:hypothetical protein